MKVELKSKATTPNPKDLFGNKKVSFTKVPSVAIAHCAAAMMDGADKYGAYNWRSKPVIASIYVDAAIRHFLDWFEGQLRAKDSRVHHLGHGMACGAILIDAEANNVLVDDRPIFDDPDLLDRTLDALSADIQERRARYAAEKEKVNAKPNRRNRRHARPGVGGKRRALRRKSSLPAKSSGRARASR